MRTVKTPSGTLLGGRSKDFISHIMRNRFPFSLSSLVGTRKVYEIVVKFELTTLLRALER
jgi:hypothetical protein